MNLVELLEKNGSSRPNSTAMVDGSARVSFLELWSLGRAVSEDLRRQGIVKGGTVGVRLPDGILYVAVTLALWLLDAVVVPIPMEMPKAEADELIRRVQLSALITGAGNGRQFGRFLAGDGYSVWRAAPESRCDMRGVNAAFVRFTSGTTGNRRGVVLSHETIRDRLHATGHALGINNQDTVMWCLPMAHHFVSTILLYLLSGAKIVMVRNISDLAPLTGSHRGTIIYASPRQFELLAGHGSREALSTIRLALSTTTSLPKATFDKVHSRFGISVRQVYGIIEVGLPCGNMSDPVDRWDSVGKAFPSYEVKLVRQEQYRDIGENCGEVRVRGHGLFDTYYDPWVSAADVLEDGWFSTGDVGEIDGDGFLFLRGRTNGVINISGMKVFPEEVESALNSHPSVKESRVYPRRHAHLGQVVEADVVVRTPDTAPDEDELRMYCRERLSSYKVPEMIHFVKSLPKTAITQKLRRTDMSEASGT
jgi:long-chain acyl-CoA synthetase